MTISRGTKYFFSIICLLVLAILAGSVEQSYAQNTNPSFINSTKQKDKSRKNRRNDNKRNNYLGKEKERETEYQGEGKKLVQKVKAPSKRDKIDSESERAAYSGNEKYVNIEQKRADKNRKLSKFAGKIPMRKVKYHQKDIEYGAADRADYSGNVRYFDAKKERAKLSRQASNYSGNIRFNPNKRARQVRDKQREISDYSGNVPYLNIPKLRQRKATKLANFKGPIAIRVKQKPKGSVTSTYKGAPNKNRFAANYSRKRFKSGKFVKKSDLPNYQKTKPGKLKYDSRETKMWQNGGGALPTRGERKLPKTSKKAKRQADQDAQKLLDKPSESGSPDDN
ncbi:MAG: hypothetical protein MUE85_23180 [Microscillaceae bacterium]|jgi:hypothetical protein|nr:hypothetical protein [Microscillaceae bacterium]